MKWATRPNCHVDRIACAWLLRRCVDPEATFVFVEDVDDVPTDVTPFDMRNVELSHHNGDCSFETILRHFGIDDPILWDIARMVHEADVHDERYLADEAIGLDAVCSGIAMIHNDHDTLQLGAQIFNGLYEYRRSLLSGRIS
jgi:hypothetical protein